MTMSEFGWEVKMKKACLLAAILCLTPIVEAGFVKIECDFGPQNGSIVIDGQQVQLVESYAQDTPYIVGLSGITDEDPDLGLIKTVTNDTEQTWTAYSLTLGGDAAFVSASSDLLPVASVSSNSVLFSGGTVASGETLKMSFVVNVPVIGDFKFCLTQLAIPEPASLFLLGLGGLGFLGRRR